MFLVKYNKKTSLISRVRYSYQSFDKFIALLSNEKICSNGVYHFAVEVQSLCKNMVKTLFIFKKMADNFVESIFWGTFA